MNGPKWEYYQDYSFYGMFAVKPVDDRNFNSPRLFHVMTKHDAELLVEILDRAFMSFEVKNEI